MAEAPATGGTARSLPRFTRMAPETRRQEILLAARRCLARGGMYGFTVAEIATEAGISNGLIGHYFPSKDELLAATYEAEAERLVAASRAAVAASGNDPDSRLVALVESAFSPDIFDEETAAVWLALWAQVRMNPALSSAHRDLYADYRRAFAKAMTRAAAERGLRLDTRAIAADISALIDGLWLQWALDPLLFTPCQARQACYRLLAANGLEVRLSEEAGRGAA